VAILPGARAALGDRRAAYSIRAPACYGWLRGEAFYQGMPTSYWHAEITRLNREPTWMDKLLERLGPTRIDYEYVYAPTIDKPGRGAVRSSMKVPTALLTEDQAALPVLIAMLRTDDELAQDIAALVLSRFGAKAQAAVPALRDVATAKERSSSASALSALRAIEAAAKVGAE